MSQLSNLNIFSENDLVKSFIGRKHWEKYFGESNRILEQVETLGGIPDVIIIAKNHYKSLELFADKFPFLELTNGYAKTLATLRSSRLVSYDQLSKISGLTRRHLKKILRDFKLWGIVQENANSKFTLESNFKIPDIEIWSVEFKLDNWRRALRQALRHRSFSHYSLVVMPDSKERVLNKNKEFFEQFGVGSFTYSGNTGQFKPIVEPARRNLISDHAYLDVLGRIMPGKFQKKSSSIVIRSVGKVSSFFKKFFE